MKDSNGGWIFFLVFVACPILYVLFRLLPDLVFYVLPFGLTAVVLGGLFSVGCEAEPIDYKRLAIFYPATAFLLLLFLGFPSTQCQLPITKAQIESPWLFHAFNDLNSGIQGLINWSWLSYYRWMVPILLPPIKYEPILYDLRDLSWCIWLGGFFGAPAIVFTRGKKSDSDRIKKLEAAFEAKQKEADNKRHLQWKDQDRRIHQLKCELEDVTKEREKLKAVAAAIQNRPLLPPAPGDGNGGEGEGSSGSSPAGGGVFGSDFLG